MYTRRFTGFIFMIVLIFGLTGCLVIPDYTLSVIVTGEGTVNPMGGVYPKGTAVSLTAAPDPNWKFASWGGGASGNSPQTSVVMTQDTVVTARFVKIQYAVSVSWDGQGQVVETLVSTPSSQYQQGSKLKLQAVPADGWKFKEWKGDVTGTANPVTIDIDKPYTIKAVFEEAESGEAEWNFLVYLDGDNDLESEAILDLNEMESVGSTAKVNILVLLDRHPQYDRSNGDWAGTRLYRVTKDTANSMNIVSQLVKDYGELDMSDPDVLEEFIVYCQTAYPAKRTVLTLWDHGAGVYPKSIPRGPERRRGILSPQGICWDDTTGTNGWDCLTTDEIAGALAGARAETGQKIDIINMDACLMQMIEIAYEWRNEADYLVGSEEVVPGAGNNYVTVLNDIVSNPAIRPLDLACQLVDRFYEYYQVEGEGFETYSVLSLGTEFTALMAAFNTFAAALQNTGDMAGVYAAYMDTTGFDYPEYRDLYGFAKKIAKVSVDLNLTSAAVQLMDEWNDAVLYHRETFGYAGNVFGLAINFPSDEEWDYYSDPDQYTDLLFARDTQWDEFLLRFVDYTASR